MKLRIFFPVAGLLSVLLSPEASAQFNRTAVSINGSDLNNCAPASPCRSFARAILQTNPGGEVIALDSGGYGAFTVDRSATVMAAPGVYAGITAASTTDGITINATASSRIVLRNLFVISQHTANAGVAITGPAAGVHIEQLVIDGFVNWAIISFGNVVVSNTTIRNSGTGIWIDNAGAAVAATIEHVIISDFGGGAAVQPGRAVMAWRNSNVTVRDTVATFGPVGFQASGNGILTVENCVATHNNVGIWSQDSAVVRISNNVVTHNQTGVVNVSAPASSLFSWGNNKVAGNAINDVTGPLGGIGQY